MKKRVEDEQFIDPEDLVSENEQDGETDEDILVDEAELSYEEGLEDGLKADSEITHVRERSVIQQREDTRSTLALIYTMATFVVFILGMAIAVFDGIINDVSIVENLSEVIPLISGVFLGSLGFVLGYYFRKKDE